MCGTRRCTPQDGLNACQQIVHVKGLADEVVGAEFERQDRVGSAGTASDDDDGDIGDALEQAAQDQPVDVGEHQVEQDQIRGHRRALHLAARLFSVERVPHAVVSQLERVHERTRYGRVVVDDQD